MKTKKRIGFFMACMFVFLLLNISSDSAQPQDPAGNGAPHAQAMTALNEQSSASQSAGITLKECYLLALKQSELIAIDSDVIKETEARFLEAFGAILPHVSFSMSQFKQDHRFSRTMDFSNNFERKFVSQQTLFSGFREFAAIAGSKHEHRQRVQEKARAEQLLMVDVADAFYLLIQQQEDIKALEMVRDALAGRVEELKKREQLGRSRQSEVVSVEAQLYAVEADLELGKSQEIIARHLLGFLTGKDIDLVSDSQEAFPVLEPEAHYTSRMQARPDVQAAKEAWEVSRRKVTIAQADFFPTVTLENDYYHHRTTTPLCDTWAATLSVDFPVFEGTTTLGAVREAGFKAHESELLYQRTSRSALQDIRDAYVQLQTALSRTEALQKAQDAAQKNYELQKQDYQLNLVNNLDVLQSIQTLENTRIDFIQSLYDTKRQYWQFRMTVGETILTE